MVICFGNFMCKFDLATFFLGKLKIEIKFKCSLKVIKKKSRICVLPSVLDNNIIISYNIRSNTLYLNRQLSLNNLAVYGFPLFSDPPNNKNREYQYR